jgi:hypothetical protein
LHDYSPTPENVIKHDKLKTFAIESGGLPGTA